MIPGEYFLASDPVIANADRRTEEVEVANTGDRPIQVGSHFHFFEVNRSLRFDRARAFGMRLNIPRRNRSSLRGRATTNELCWSNWAEPQRSFGLNGLTNGPADQSAQQSVRKKAACETARAQGFEGS